MNLLADESVDGPIVKRLRQEGHEVEYVAEMSPGIDDAAVRDHANSRDALLMTADKDFGELVFRLRQITRGIVLLRLSGVSAAVKARIVADALRTHGQQMVHAFTVISSGLVRIRRGT